MIKITPCKNNLIVDKTSVIIVRVWRKKYDRQCYDSMCIWGKNYDRQYYNSVMIKYICGKDYVGSVMIYIKFMF